jgi:hypothetical protein
VYCEDVHLSYKYTHWHKLAYAAAACLLVLLLQAEETACRAAVHCQQLQLHLLLLLLQAEEAAHM